MPTRRVFDRAAGFYDRTRPLPDEVATEGIDALLKAAGGLSARILEAGVGTGRIAIPLWERGANLTGIDLSRPMMTRLHEKFPPARTAQGDIALLPFGDNQFDAVVTVHVLHLLRDWQEALGEFKRVLRPGGVVINAFRQTRGDSPRNELRSFWQSWLEAHDPAETPVFLGVRDKREIEKALESLGAKVSLEEATHYRESYRLNEVIEQYAHRVLSSTWDIDDTVLAASVNALRGWAQEEYGRLDKSFTDEIAFLLQIGRF